MITSSLPQTWQDLQADVARILSECGFAVEIEKTVATPRGNIEIDVYAQETVQGRRYSIACECKHWIRPIPQTVVHAFRTVVGDIGANVGYIVSMQGFQSGSRRAQEWTNLELVNWQEFQARFEESWFEHFFTQEIHRRLSPLMSYSESADGLVPAWYHKMADPDRQAYETLVEKYANFGFMVQRLGPYMRRLTNGPIPSLPLRNFAPDLATDSVPKQILDEAAYRELLEVCIAHGQGALEEFRSLASRYAV